MAKPYSTRRLSLATKRRLLSLYYSATACELEEGASWYANANKIARRLAKHYDISVKQACGVIAAISPGLVWEKNASYAEIIIDEYRTKPRKISIVGVYGKANVNKSRAILAGKEPLDILGGDKVRNFYLNILNPKDAQAITIDRHAKSAAYGYKLLDGASAKQTILRSGEYAFIARHFVACASELGLIPNQFQAICWLAWRRLNPYRLPVESEVPF